MWHRLLRLAMLLFSFVEKREEKRRGEEEKRREGKSREEQRREEKRRREEELIKGGNGGPGARAALRVALWCFTGYYLEEMNARHLSEKPMFLRSCINRCTKSCIFIIDEKRI